MLLPERIEYVTHRSILARQSDLGLTAGQRLPMPETAEVMEQGRSPEHLAVERKVSASTQNQALCAVVLPVEQLVKFRIRLPEAKLY